MHAPVIPRTSVRPPPPPRAVRPAAAFTIDAGAGLLLAADAAGWAAWGLDAARAVPPVAIDAAMPALHALREMAHAGAGADAGDDAPRMLTFWTARGLARWRCRVEPAPACGGGAVFAVHLLAPAADPGAGGHGGAPQEVALTAWLAHELRTPLGAVIACAEILKSEHFGPLADVRYRSYAHAIYDSARHALGVVDGILRGDPARSGVPPLAFADLDPVAVVESCLAVARPLAERAGLALRGEYAPGLPRIVADELSVRQMLLNLLGNAIKFARRGDRVSVAIVHEADGCLTMTVADTGPGMDAARPADAPAPSATGLGLGLPLSRALAAANGATLAIDSAPGQGTRVAIAFGKDRVVPV